METEVLDDPADDSDPDYPHPNALRRFEALQVVARGEVTPPQGQPRPTVAGIFHGRIGANTSPGLASVDLPVSVDSVRLVAYLSGPPEGPGQFGANVVWIECEVVQRLPGHRLKIRLAPHVRSEHGSKDFVVREAQVFE